MVDKGDVMKSAYLIKAGIDENRIDGVLNWSDEERARKVCYEIFAKLLKMYFYDKSVTTERGKVCETENEVLSYLYRKCGLVSSFVREDEGQISSDYVKVYIGKSLDIIDVSLARAMQFEGLEEFNEKNFCMSEADRYEYISLMEGVSQL